MARPAALLLLRLAPLASGQQAGDPSPFQSLLAGLGWPDHLASGSSPELRLARQAGQAVPGGVDFSQATRQPDGRMCVIKEAKVETLSKDPILECKHRDVEQCHYTYITYFKPAQQETCEENFEKTCQITFRQEAVQEVVRKCYRPVEKVCNGQGPEECRTVYESSCSTRSGPGEHV
jgi:hypothetical protein